MQELLSLIQEERKVFEEREHFSSQVATRYKCVHRLHWLKHQQPTLHQLYDLERKIEERGNLLFEQNKDNPETIMQLIAVFRERINKIIDYIKKEKKHWIKIHQNIQKELDDNIEEYNKHIHFLKLREISLEGDTVKTH